MIDFSEMEGFEWDDGNISKNLKHNVPHEECEEVFFDKDLKILSDTLHSDKEERFVALGKTQQERLLYLAFTVRINKIRVISARDINKKEKHLYEKSN
jgi:uncharacterized DUF497 family protein